MKDLGMRALRGVIEITSGECNGERAVHSRGGCGFYAAGEDLNICQRASSPRPMRFGNKSGAKGGAPCTKLSKTCTEGPAKLALV